MYFTPAIGTGGYLGWRILEKTADKQMQTMESSPMLSKNVDYFRENISNAKTAEALVNDRRLLTVALGAYGLGDQINNKALIKKVLEGGTEDSDALANKLSDVRFRKFSEAFGYGNIDQGANVLLDSFREDVIARYKTQEFENAVGDLDNDMRLALYFKRTIKSIAESDSSDATRWFQIMGDEPLREVVSTALNLPTALSQIDIDQQQEVFADSAEKYLDDSSPSVFQNKDAVDDVIRRFFLMRQIDKGPSSMTPGYAALTMLQSSGLGSASAANLILSQS